MMILWTVMLLMIDMMLMIVMMMMMSTWSKLWSSPLWQSSLVWWSWLTLKLIEGLSCQRPPRPDQGGGEGLPQVDQHIVHIVAHIVNHIVDHIVDQHILTVSSYSGLTALSQATESSSHKTNHLTSPVALFTVVTFFLFRDFADAFNKALKFRSNYNPSTNLHIFSYASSSTLYPCQ